MKRCLALILFITVLFCGCREGGYDRSSGTLAEESYEEFNVGERSVSRSSHTASSSSTMSSSSSSRSSTSESSTSTTTSSSTSTVSSSSSSSTSVSTQTSSSTSTASASVSSTAPANTSSRSSEPIIVPEEPVSSSSAVSDIPNDNFFTGGDNFNIGSGGAPSDNGDHFFNNGNGNNGGGSAPADNDNGDIGGSSSDIGGVPADTNGSSFPAEESSIASSSEPPEPAPEPGPEPKVSPYDYDGPVYVASSGKGIKYHLYPSCSNMKGTIEMYVPEALEKGFTPCKKCWEV